MPDALALTALYETHNAYLWNLGYRMLGTVEDADDVLQETFVHLLEHPPADDAPAGLPWLTHAGLSVARQALADRQARDYPPPWLPGPAPDAKLEIPGASYDGAHTLADSARVGFLLALEPLAPDARAALVLTDVFAQSVEFASAGLGVDAAQLEALLAQARPALADWSPPSSGPVQAQLDALVSAARAGDVAAATKLCAADVRVRCDGGGMFATTDQRGPDAAAAFVCALAKTHGAQAKVKTGAFNHAPAAVWKSDAGDSGAAETSVLRLTLDPAGQIADLQCVQASDKLGGVWGFGIGDD